jgi:steroid delta-isomerase-like uncharacterized protein
MDPEPTTKGGQMAQSAEDVARESIEAITPVTSTGSARFSPTTYEEEPYAAPSRGGGCRVEAAQNWKQAFPDEHGAITGAYTSGNAVAIELTWEGTQSGPLATPDCHELPPSNKRITVKSVEVIEIEDGKIKVLRHYFDLMTILQQIGAMDQAETAIASRLHSGARGREAAPRQAR